MSAAECVEAGRCFSAMNVSDPEPAPGLPVFRLQEQFHQALEQGHVAADADLQVEIGQRRGPKPSSPRTSCGFLKAISPASFSGLTAMILQPLRFARCKASNMRGMVRAGVLAENEDHFGLVEVARA